MSIHIMPDIWTSLVMLLGGFAAGFFTHRVIVLGKPKRGRRASVWARLR